MKNSDNINILKLGARAASAIFRAGLTTIGDIRNADASVFLSQKGVGRKTLLEIMTAVGKKPSYPPLPRLIGDDDESD